MAHYHSPGLPPPHPQRAQRPQLTHGLYGQAGAFTPSTTTTPATSSVNSSSFAYTNNAGNNKNNNININTNIDEHLPSGASGQQYGTRDLDTFQHQQHVTLGGALVAVSLETSTCPSSSATPTVTVTTPTTAAAFATQTATSAPPFLPPPSTSLSFARGNPPPHTFNPQAAAAAALAAVAHQPHQLPHRHSGGSTLPSELHSQERAKREALARGFGTNSNYPPIPRSHSSETSAATTAEVVAAVLDNHSRSSIPSLVYNQHSYINPQPAYHYPYAMPGSTIPDSSQNGNPASPTGSSNGTGNDGVRKSPPRARLTEQEKKNNHIASEQKRRNAIRDGFDHLTELIPGCEGQGRSEGMVLNKSIDYIRDQLNERRKLIEKIEALGGVVPPELREV